MTNVSWQTKKLGEITVINGGGTPPTSHAEYFNGDVPWFTPSEITSGTVSVLTNSQRQITEEATKFSKVAEQGTVLLSSRATIGNIGIVSNRSTYNQGIKGIAPKEDLNPWFLAYWLLANKKILEKSSYGTTFKELSTTALKKFDITIPHLPVQQQIVNNLDAIRKLQELKQKEIEKAEELFDSGISSFFNLNGVTKPLGDICKVVGGGTPSRENKSFYLGKIPWVTIKDLNTIEISDSKEHINENAISKSATNLVEENTILVATRVGLGKMGMTKTKLTFNQDIKGLICFKEILPYYLLYFLLSQARFIERSGRGATVKGINQDLLKKIKIPLPEISIQQKTIDKLDSLFQFKRELLQAKNLSFELFKSTLNKLMRPN